MGRDGIAAGILKYFEDVLVTAMIKLTNSSLRLGLFSKCFKEASMIILKKPCKKNQELQFANSYRPISLMSTLGKSLEAAMGKNLLKQLNSMAYCLSIGQMGNRKN